jgi:predicted membrane metal-binding protein
MFIGYVLIVLGAILLMQNLGFLTEGFWLIFFPSLIILFGLYLVVKKSKGKNDSASGDL